MGAPSQYNERNELKPMPVDDLDVWGWGSAFICAGIVFALLYALLRHYHLA